MLVSTWEERMSLRAKERMRAEDERQRAAEEAEYQAEVARIAEEQRGEFEAGPQGGCRDCFVWVPDKFSPRHFWIHRSDESGWCHHECHGGEPYGCAPMALA